MSISQFAYRHIRSFRREQGGLYAIYSATYSRVYGLVMTRRHRNGRHGPLMGLSGRCTWCGEKP
jgi:hypothetical protein